MAVAKILLDTNAYTALNTGNEAVKRAVERANKIYMSPIVLGE